MLILLPPSEGKNFSLGNSQPVDLKQLSFPELNTPRKKLLDALVSLGDNDEACHILGIGPQKRHEVSTHKDLLRANSKMATEVYSGVLYEAANWNNWPQNHAASSVLITSALWGLVAPTDMITPYRLSMGVTLPEVGPVKKIWKTALQPALDRVACGQIVIDCRSGIYQSTWPPTVTTAKRAGCKFLPVKVFTRRNGKEKVVSHYAKHARGEYVGYLVAQDLEIETISDALAAALNLAKESTSSVIDARLESSSGKDFLILITG